MAGRVLLLVIVGGPFSHFVVDGWSRSFGRWRDTGLRCYGSALRLCRLLYEVTVCIKRERFDVHMGSDLAWLRRDGPGAAGIGILALCLHFPFWLTPCVPCLFNKGFNAQCGPRGLTQ